MSSSPASLSASASDSAPASDSALPSLSRDLALGGLLARALRLANDVDLPARGLGVSGVLRLAELIEHRGDLLLIGSGSSPHPIAAMPAIRASASAIHVLARLTAP